MITSTINNSPKRHHYVPQFLIKNWANEDGSVRTWRRTNGLIVESHEKPKNVMAQNHLYRLKNVAPEKQTAIEAVFAKIEGRAGETLIELLKGNGDLTTDHRIRWSLLVLAIRCRNPSRIDNVREMYNQPEVLHLKKDLEQRGQGFIDDYTLGMMVKAAGNPDALKSLLHMQWQLGRFEDTHKILLGDNPIVIEGNLLTNNCVLYLPVSPNHIFVAASNRELISQLIQFKPKELSAALNRKQAAEADREMVGDAPKRFFENHFKV